VTIARAVSAVRGLCRGAPVFEIVHNLYLVVPSGFLTALALILVSRRHKRRSRGQTDIGFWFRFSKNTSVDRFVRSPPDTLIRARGKHAVGLVADRFLGRKVVDGAMPASSPRTFRELRGARMLPLYAARIEDLGSGDFVKVDCSACQHVALLTPEALLRFGLSPAAKVLDLKGRLRCRGCGRKGRAVVSIKWRKQGS